LEFGAIMCDDFSVMKSPQESATRARVSSGWAKLWLASALAIWAFDGVVISQSLPVLLARSNESLGRAGICQWEQDRFMNSMPLEVPEVPPGEGCMTGAEEFERAAAQRTLALNEARLFVARWIALIAAVPFGIAGGFIAISSVGRFAFAHFRRIQPQYKRRYWGS
jgi:hypothetical protein